MNFFRNIWRNSEVASTIIIAVLLQIVLFIIIVNGDSDLDEIKDYFSYSEESDEEGVTSSPDEIAIDTAIDDTFETMCLTAYGDCWLKLKDREQRLSHDDRRALCLQRVKGWVGICDGMEDNDTEHAIEEAEKKYKVIKMEKSIKQNRTKEADKRKRGFHQKMLEIKRAKNKRGVSADTYG